MKNNKNNLMGFCYKYDGKVLLGYRPQKWTVGEETLLKRHLEVCTHCQTYIMEMELFCEEKEVVENTKDAYSLQTEQRLLEITEKKHKRLIFKRLKWKLKSSLRQINLQLTGIPVILPKYKNAFLLIMFVFSMNLFFNTNYIYSSEHKDVEVGDSDAIENNELPSDQRDKLYTEKYIVT